MKIDSCYAFMIKLHPADGIAHDTIRNLLLLSILNMQG